MTDTVVVENISSSSAALLVSELFLALHIFYLLGSYLNTKGYSLRWLPIPKQRFLNFWIILFALGFGITKVLGIQYISLAFLLAACVVTSFLSPVHAISIFAALFILRPWELVNQQPVTMTYIPKILACVCVCSCFFHTLSRTNFRIRWNLPFTVFLCFVAWLFISALFSANTVDCLSYLFKHFYPILVITVLVLNMLNTNEEVHILNTTIGFCVCGVIVTAFYESYFTNFNPLYETRLHTSTFWGNPNDLGALILIALPFVVFPFVLRAKNMEVLTIGLLMTLTLLIGLFATQSRGAVLGLVVASATFITAKRTNRLMISLLLLAFVTTAFIFAFIQRSSEDRNTSDVSRLTYAIAGINMVKARPIFGVGIGNYPKEYENYSPDFYEWGQRNAHSSWILPLSEAGLIGFILFTCLFALTLKRAWMLRTDKPEYLFSLMGYGTAMSLLAHTYTFPPYLLFALIIIAQYQKNKVNSTHKLANSSPCY